MRSPHALLVAGLLAALPAPAHADGSIVLFPALGRPTLVTVSGRYLKSTPEGHSKGLSKNLRRLASDGVEAALVTVTFGGQTRRTRTGSDGLFDATFPAGAGSPFPLGLQPARAESEGIVGAGKISVVADDAPFLVVSDFDDTVAVTHVTSKTGLLKSALLADEDTQPAVEGMALLYGCLGSLVPTPGFAFVSGSPVEFGPRLEAFLAKHKFPFAALHLRVLGPKTLSGYKEGPLRALLSRFPQKFVLVGDSGEADPEVYAAIREEFPDRVLAIFIHDVGKSADPKRFKDMVLFKTAADALKVAAERGLLNPQCLPAPY